MPYTLPNKLSHGFTLVEVMVIAPIVILVIAGFVALMVTLTGDVLRTKTTNTLIYDSQAGIDIMEQDILFATEFRDNSYTPVSPQGLNNTASPFTPLVTIDPSGQNTLFILRSLTTDKNPLDSTRKLIYKANAPNACGSANESQNSPYLVDIVYYLTNDTPTSYSVWRRVLVDPASTACSPAPWQRSSCYPGQTGAPCVASDSKIMTNVSGFARYYYPSASSATTINTNLSYPYSATDGSNAKTIYLILSMSKTIAGRDATYSADLRASRINTLKN